MPPHRDENQVVYISAQGESFTSSDFLKLTFGNWNFAQEIFTSCTGQHPRELNFCKRRYLNSVSHISHGSASFERGDEVIVSGRDVTGRRKRSFEGTYIIRDFIIGHGSTLLIEPEVNLKPKEKDSGSPATFPLSSIRHRDCRHYNCTITYDGVDRFPFDRVIPRVYCNDCKKDIESWKYDGGEFTHQHHRDLVKWFNEGTSIERAEKRNSLKFEFGNIVAHHLNCGCGYHENYPFLFKECFDDYELLKLMFRDNDLNEEQIESIPKPNFTVTKDIEDILYWIWRNPNDSVERFREEFGRNN